jgi:transposase
MMKYLENISTFVSNKMVFCGIDVHKLNWSLCYICDGQFLEELSIEGNSQILLAHTDHLYKSAKAVNFVYEAGFSGFHLYRKLTAHNYNCMITPPNRVPKSGDKVKTDKRDAKKLAQYLAGGLLKKVYVTSELSEADRQILRLRTSCQSKMTRVKNQIKSYLNLHGLNWSSKSGHKWTKCYIAWLESLEFEHPSQRILLDDYLQEYHFLGNRIARITAQIRTMSRQPNYNDDFLRLTSCKGVGLVTAMTFLLELHDVLRFSSAEKFCSYLGLTPCQFSSGESVRLGHITREGNSHVRRVLIESAWTVIRHDPVLNKKYNRIKARGANGKKAIVATARSLAIRLRHCIINKEDYVIGVC